MPENDSQIYSENTKACQKPQEQVEMVGFSSCDQCNNETESKLELTKHKLKGIHIPENIVDYACIESNFIEESYQQYP